MITSDQIRAARGLIRWSAEDLARESGVGLSTIRRIEAADGVPAASAKNLALVQRALELAGVLFIPENGNGPGVRRKDRVSEWDTPAFRLEAAIRHLLHDDVQLPSPGENIASPPVNDTSKSRFHTARHYLDKIQGSLLTKAEITLMEKEWDAGDFSAVLGKLGFLRNRISSESAEEI